MSVSLTSSGYGINSYRKLGVVYFNGNGTTGTNYPLGSVIQVNSSVSLTGKWSGCYVTSYGSGMNSTTSSSVVTEVSSISWGIGVGFYIIQRVS